MKPSIEGSEKAWVSFGVVKRDLKREQRLQKYLKLLVKESLKRKNNEPIDQAQSQKLQQFGQKLLRTYGSTPSSSYTDQLLKKRKDGSWKIDREKYDQAIQRIIR
jgi:hypothetical protein